MSPQKVVPIFWFVFRSNNCRYQQRQEGCCDKCKPKLNPLLKQWVELEPKPTSRCKVRDTTARKTFLFQKIIQPDGKYSAHTDCIRAALACSQTTLAKLRKERKENAFSSNISGHGASVSSKSTSLREADLLKTMEAFLIPRKVHQSICNPILAKEMV